MFTKQQALKDAQMDVNVYSIYVYRNWYNYSKERVKYNDDGSKKKLLNDRERVKKIQQETSYRPS